MGLLTNFRLMRMAMKQDKDGMMKLAAREGIYHVDIDPNDPDFAPVDGVDVDTYARTCEEVVRTFRSDSLDDAACDRIVREHGVDPSRWKEIADVWNERVMRSPKVKARYAETFLDAH